MRRVTGRSLGTMVRHEVAGPLGADLSIGVPEGDLVRVAEFIGHGEPATLGKRDLTDEQRMEWHAYCNPPEFSGAGVINTAQWRMAELASTNGHATAGGIARLYGALVAGGAIDGTEVVDRSRAGRGGQ